MKFIYGFIILGLIGVSVLILSEKASEHLAQLEDDVESKLLKDLESMHSGTDSYIRTFRAWQAIRIKRDIAHIHAEAPGVFENALSEIKVNYQGKTYLPNYKKIQLEKAIKSATQRRRISKSIQPLPWIERGPGNVSGRVRDILPDLDNPTTHWYVASVGGGIWKTTNAGLTWVNKTPQLTTLSTMTIGMAPSDHNIMYAGTGMGYGRLVDLAGSGVWKSTDRGDTWFQLQSTANGQVLRAINRLVIDPTNPNIVILCSNDDYTSFGPNGGQRISGIFKTTDGGATWYQTYDPDVVLGTNTDNRIQQIVANPLNFNTLYATVNEVGVIKSMDAGETWFVSANNFADPADIGFGEGTYQGISTRTEMAIAPTDTSRLYAAVERRRGTAKLFMSTNAGTSWQEVIDTGTNPNWFTSGGASGTTGAYTAGWFDNTLAVNPFNANSLVVGGVEIYGVTVNPTAFTRQTVRIASVNQVHADHHDLVQIPLNAQMGAVLILNANDGGISTWTTGGTWKQITGMTTTQFYGVDKKKGVSAYIGGMQDNGTFFSSNDPSVSTVWTRALGGDGVEVAWNYRDANLMLGGSQYGVYSRSTNGGASWYLIPQATAGASPFVSKIASSKSDPDLVFTVGQAGINRSDDFGATWSITPITGNWLGFRAFDNVDISLADPQVVWATSRLDNAPFIGVKGGIHVSTDGGLSFKEVSNNFPDNLTESSGFATHPIDRNTAYALFSAAGTPKVMKTTNLGQTWEDMSQFDDTGESQNGFPNVATFSLLVMPYDTNIIWAGTEIGLFVSNDGGANWVIADNGIPNVGIFQMSIVDDEIIVATYGRGVWTVKKPELVGYTPAVVTLSPRMKTLAQQPSGNIVFQVDLRSSYDSTLLLFGNEVLMRLGSNAIPTDTNLFFPVTASQTISGSVQSYKNGQKFSSPTKTIQVYAVAPQTSYINNFNTLSSDFFGNGFTISSAPGFSNGAVHSPHPYANNAQYTYQLKVPVIIREGNSTLQYDDVALVEEGLPGTVWTDPNFFDFVVVEGTKDGSNWIALSDGYDSRYNATWSSAYKAGLIGQNSNTAGNSNMFVHHTINLLENFDPGDEVFIRFRLLADPAAWAWGWAIDNIVMNGDVTPPVLTLGALATPVLNLVRFGVGANETLSSASVVVNSQNLSMMKQGGIFFGDYLIEGAGLMTVIANGSDSSLNSGAVINRTYTISPLVKPLILDSYRFESAGNGFLVAGICDAGAVPSGWMRIGSVVDVIATGHATANIRVTLVSNPAFDQSKIGLYLWRNEQWTPLSMGRKNGQLSASVSGGKIAAFYNPESRSFPSEFKLHFNYPNPFNPTTTISYEAPIQSKVVLKIYNALGQEIRTLVNEIKPAGYHQLIWDGRNESGQSVASGIYIYRIVAGKYVKSHKMLLLK